MLRLAEMAKIVPKNILFCRKMSPTDLEIWLQSPTGQAVRAERKVTGSVGEALGRLQFKLFGRDVSTGAKCKLWKGNMEIPLEVPCGSAFVTGNSFDISEIVPSAKAYSVIRDYPHIARFRTNAVLQAGLVYAPRLEAVPSGASCIVEYYFSSSPVKNKLKSIIAAFNAENRDALTELGLYLVSKMILGSHEFYDFALPESTAGQHMMIVARPYSEQFPESIATFNYIGQVSPKRPFVFDERHRLKVGGQSDESLITICSYNILADLYIRPGPDGFFPYCPKEFVDKRYRYPVLLTELNGYKLDLACLQEVDVGFAQSYAGPSFCGKGYGVIFAKKAEKVNEGCLILFRKSKFTLISEASFVISDLLWAFGSDEILSAVDSKLPLTRKRLCALTTILQICMLHHEASGSIFIVANTHLFWDPEWAHLKVIQLALCLKKIEMVKEDYLRDNPDTNVAVVLCGDLNSQPKSGTVTLAVTGSFPADHPEWVKAPETMTIKKRVFTPGIPLSHGLNLRSACGYPEYTNYTESFSGCLDYIFVDDSLTVDRIYPMPDHSLIAEHGALPSKHCASDHLPLLCDVCVAQ